MPATQFIDQPEPPAVESRVFTRIVLGVATMLVSVNLWTGSPLLAVWIGSRIQASVGHLSFLAVVGTIVVLSVQSYVLYKLLAILSLRYDAAIGREVPRYQHPWLRPMSGERRSITIRRPLSAVERIVVVTVVVATLVFEVWFFFFAHYALP